MKPDKLFRAPHIILITKRFNEVHILFTLSISMYCFEQCVEEIENDSTGFAIGCVGSYPPAEFSCPHRCDWKMDSCSRHLPLSSQFVNLETKTVHICIKFDLIIDFKQFQQRSTTNLFRVHQQRCFSAQENLGKTFQNGLWLFLNWFLLDSSNPLNLFCSVL